MKKYLFATLLIISQLDAKSDGLAPLRGGFIGFVGGCIAYVCDYINCSVQNAYTKMTQSDKELVNVNGTSICGALIVKKNLKLKKPFDLKKLLITTTIIGLLAGAANNG